MARSVPKSNTWSSLVALHPEKWNLLRPPCPRSEVIVRDSPDTLYANQFCIVSTLIENRTLNLNGMIDDGKPNG